MPKALRLLIALAIIVGAVALQITVSLLVRKDPEDLIAPTERSAAAIKPDEQRELFNGDWSVTDGYINISPEIAGFVDPTTAFTGQANGLVGAADGVALVVITPQPVGTLDLAVELYGTEPAAPSWCQDEVKVSFKFPAQTALRNVDTSLPLAVPEGTYRVRYCASEQDAAAAGDAGSVMPGQYQLQLWPDRAPSGDEVIQQASEFAKSQNAG